MATETNENKVALAATQGTDESARDEPGFGDPKMSSGPVVDEQLEALGAFGKNPADKADKKDSLDEVFEAAKTSDNSEEVKEEVEEAEEEKEEVEEEEIKEDKEELEEPTPSSEEDEEEEEESDEEPSEEETVEELSELETLKIQNAKLMEILNSNAVLQESIPAEKPPEQLQQQQVQQQQQAEPQRIPLTIPKLPEVDATELDSIISDPAAFNDHMKKVFDAGQQSMYSMLPRVVSSQVETQMVMDRFFVENKDLVPMSQYVKQAAIEIQTLDPSASAAIALEKAGDKIRGALGFVKRVDVKEGRKQKGKKRSHRRFAPATSKRQGPTKSSRSKKAKEVDPNSFEAQFAELEKVGEPR